MEVLVQPYYMKFSLHFNLANLERHISPHLNLASLGNFRENFCPQHFNFAIFGKIAIREIKGELKTMNDIF